MHYLIKVSILGVLVAGCATKGDIDDFRAYEEGVAKSQSEAISKSHQTLKSNSKDLDRNFEKSKDIESKISKNSENLNSLIEDSNQTKSKITSMRNQIVKIENRLNEISATLKTVRQMQKEKKIDINFDRFQERTLIGDLNSILERANLILSMRELYLRVENFKSIEELKPQFEDLKLDLDFVKSNLSKLKSQTNRNYSSKKIEDIESLFQTLEQKLKLEKRLSISPRVKDIKESETTDSNLSKNL